MKEQTKELRTTNWVKGSSFRKMHTAWTTQECPGDTSVFVN